MVTEECEIPANCEVFSSRNKQSTLATVVAWSQSSFPPEEDGCCCRGFLDLEPDRFVKIDENTYRTIANEPQCYALRLREREYSVQEVPARRATKIDPLRSRIRKRGALILVF
jgi:hypothetical protein